MKENKCKPVVSRCCFWEGDRRAGPTPGERGGGRATTPGVVSNNSWECFTLKIHQIHKDDGLAPPQNGEVVEGFFMSPWKKH